MRKLLFSLGSPFARAVRIILAELNLEYDKQVVMTALPIDELSSMTPTLQWPTFWDRDLVLWESTTIIEYLLSTYGGPESNNPNLTSATYRPEFEWQDRLVLSTIQTFGTAATTISQMTWTGVTVTTNAHLDRSAKKLTFILSWLENQLADSKSGFQGDCVSMQDIFLASHARFISNRPIGIDLHLADFPKINALLDRLDERESFKAVPIWWWEPGVIGYEADGKPIYK